MKAKYSRLLVVDTSVARSAGEAEHPVSSFCRKVLVSIRDICHRVIMTEAIREEWYRHESRFTRKWLVSMHARRKVHSCKGMELSHLDDACKGLSAGEQDALRKDICLVEAACTGDGIIITRDDAVVAIWEKCKDRFRLSKTIRWINPTTCDAHILERL
jgi:hypothetical protein